MRSLSRLLLLLCCAGALGARPLQSQTGLYANFTGAKLSAANTGWIYGPTVGVYLDRGHFAPIHIGLDFRGSVLTGSSNESFTSGTGGVRVALVPHVIPLKPYAEALGGVGHVEVGQGSALTKATRFQYEALAGVDYTFFPRLDWRVVEFSYNGLVGLGSDTFPKTISTGIVLRLP